MGLRALANIALLLLLVGCATQGVPDGGPKDLHAPKLVRSFPSNGELNVNTQTLVLEFNEYFQLTKGGSQVLISPVPNKIPTYTVKGKTLTVLLNEPLRENTTYNFYFAEAIKDINEGNDTSFNFVFSTGSFIDSMQVRAKAVDAFTGKPLDKIWVAAYLSKDSLIDAKRPDFIAKTNSNGIAQLAYLPNEEFRLFSLKDVNSDLKFSSFEESLGFLTSSIAPGDSLYTIRTFKPRDTSTYVQSFSYIHPGILQLYLNQKTVVGGLNVTPRWISPEQSRISDTITLILPDSAVNKGTKSLSYLKNGSHDTIKYYIDKELQRTYRRPVVVGANAHHPKKPINVKHDRTVSKIDVNKIWVRKDSIDIPFQAEFSGNTVFITAELGADESYNLILGKGAIIGRFLVESDTLNTKLTTTKLNYYGTVKFNVSGANGVMLLLQGEKILRKEPLNKGSVQFSQLRPGKYRVALVIDKDRDGDYTTGSWIERRQPERVFHFPDELDVRSGWDIEENWIITD